MSNHNETINNILQRYRITENKNDEYFNEEMPSTNRLFGLKDLLEYYGANKNWNVLEIGSYAGASAELISYYVGKLICCDLWEEYITPIERANIAYKDFLVTKEMNPNITECKKNSNEFVKEIQDQTFDMIYIDADHEYNSVKNDISLWFPKVKPGGIICGHDYFMDGVRIAVDEFFGKENIKYFKDSSWSYKKPESNISSKQKKFSIIIPTYNRTESLKKAIQSVINQNYKNYEVIICSEGYSSEDESCVKSFNDDRLKYYHIEKQSFKNWGHVQRNEMIKNCTGEYTIWLDDDNDLFFDYLSYANDMIDDDCVLAIFKINHNSAGELPKVNDIRFCEIDTLNAMVKTEVAKNIQWNVMDYGADFHFINDVKKYCIENNIQVKFFDKIIGNHN